MMKKIIGMLALLFLCACAPKEIPITGNWSVKDDFYKAQYKISELNDSLKAQLLYYNDGTTVYQYDGENKHFLFEKLIKDKNNYVDASSGATQTNKTNKQATFRVKATDTLELTTYLMHQPIQEIWIRNRTKNTFSNEKH